MAIAEFLGLPQLRGLWLAGPTDSGGNALDSGPSGRTLTPGGTPVWNYTSQGGNYVSFNGSSQYYYRTSESALNVTGTESEIDSSIRGITVGGWFYITGAGAGGTGLISKYLTTGNQRGYMLYLSGASSPWTSVFGISSDGSAFTNITGSVSTSAWYFLVGRFVPSTSIDLFTNNSKSSNTTSIPASIYSGTADLNLFAYNNGAAGSYTTGRGSFCFICACALSDTIISNLYAASRSLFGV